MNLDGQLVCIFGGGGFLGRYISQQLLTRGARVRIAQRHVKNAMYIKPLGNLGQTQFASTDVTKKDSVERAVSGCDAVINLVGVFGSDQEKVNVEGARNIAEAASAAGCSAMIQMSAIGADANSLSQYGRSKASGEQAARDAFPGAIVMRPSIVFGREDEFINRFASLIEMLPVVPIIGANAKFQPVYVGDVADAVANALEGSEKYAGMTFELGGPEVITMGELNHRIAKYTARDTSFIEVPDFAARILAMMPGSPISTDQFKMLQVDNIVSENASGLAALEASQTPLASLIPGWLESYTEHGRFGARAKVA